MVMNYPQDDIKKLLDDPIFLQTSNVITKHNELKTRNYITKPIISPRELEGIYLFIFVGKNIIHLIKKPAQTSR